MDLIELYHDITLEAEKLRRAQRSVLLDAGARSRRSRGPGGGGTYQTGLFGEEVVADGLRRAGWRILGQRTRTRWGELDVVARKGDTVVFGEVKTTNGTGRDLAAVVDDRAQHRLRRAAIAWMATNPRLQRGVQHYRFDVFLVYRDSGGGVERVDHIRNAF